jgi:type I restriction-modification system DNA methylase subunit
MDKLSKKELFAKCDELGITKYKSKTKTELISLLSNPNETDKKLKTFTKCDIFTPDHISKIMASKLLNRGNLLEPCVGTGNLLRSISLNKYDSIDVFEIKPEYLSEVFSCEHMNKICGDFLKTNVDKMYDNIILNPPYIKIQDLSVEYREYIHTHFPLLNGGAIDIYYAFIIKCLSLLKPDGVMVCITPNSYLYNKTSSKLRKYLFDNRLVREIIDFKEQKVFDNASVYCCITIFDKTPKTHLVYNNTEILYKEIVQNYSLFNLNSFDVPTLKSICKIRNGIATLRDKIFIHQNPLFVEPCWKPITKGNANYEYVIYPYENGKIMNEDKFKRENPKTYTYLLECKDELSKRDHGNKKYPAWYAYGRSQSIQYSNKKCLYIPSFVDPDKISENIYIQENTLHYNCLCIEPNDEKDLDLIKETIVKNIEFIKNNSSKLSAGWINLKSSLLGELPL